MRARAVGLPADLDALARLAGVQPSYRGNDGLDHGVDPDVVVAVLRALGVPIERAGDAPGALAAMRAEQASRCLDTVVVQRSGGAPTVDISLPTDTDAGRCWLTLVLEDGHLFRERLSALEERGAASGGRFRLGGLLDPIPSGYHELVLEGPGLRASALLVAAPRCPQVPRGWGVFLPVHALRSDDDWGSGSYRELAQLGRWTASAGSSMVGTLPLYPVFLDPPADPSPYLPVTRLGYCETYIDVLSAPELANAPVARAVLENPDFVARLNQAHRSALVDYEAVNALRRAVLQPMADALVAVGSPRRRALEEFAADHPELVVYAHFRASGERHGRNWRDWPGATGEAIGDRPLDDPVVRYHLYGQWLAATQLHQAAQSAPLYADLPVGVHPDGFDPFFEPTAFALGAQVGAPPDPFYAQGQSWSFPPLHPRGIRAQRYRHVIACLRRAFANAVALRIDHVMGLHRLYWIPDGFDAHHGAYVSYAPDELYALVALEAHRAGAGVVGEDLGTVEDGVRQTMAREGMLRSWVLELTTTPENPLPDPPSGCLSSWATHDLPRFAAYYDGEDLEQRGPDGQLLVEPTAAQVDARARWRQALAAYAEEEVGSTGLTQHDSSGAERRALAKFGVLFEIDDLVEHLLHTGIGASFFKVVSHVIYSLWDVSGHLALPQL